MSRPLLTGLRPYDMMYLSIQWETHTRLFSTGAKPQSERTVSVTISPVGNFEHCEKLGLVKINREDCLCYGEHRENCHYCNGSGFFEEKIYPYEMNISNGNFATLWNALGLEFDYCGEICPHILLEAVANVDVQLIVRANYVDASENGATFYSFGIDADQAESYLNRLSQIIIQAIARKVKIQWA